MSTPWTLPLPDPDATRRLGRALGAALQPGSVVALLGDLGAGKTSLSKAAIAALGEVDEDEVTSPTFTIASEYPGRVPALHLDVYRLSGADDLDALGFEPFDQGDAAVLIEWAERVEAGLPADRLTITLEHAPPARRATLVASGPTSEALLEALQVSWFA